MITGFVIAPFLLSLVLEYLSCRLPRRRFWRLVPPGAAAAAAVTVTLFRYYGWSDAGERAPLETLLLIPGVPALAVFLGLLVGWRAYKRLWDPRLMK